MNDKRKRDIFSNWIGSKYYEISMKWKIDIVNMPIMSALLHGFIDWMHAESKITVIILLVELSLNLKDVCRVSAYFITVIIHWKLEMYKRIWI